MIFEVVPVEVDETPQTNELPEKFVQRMALDKAMAGWSAKGRESGLPVLGADTVVVADDYLMGKPRDREQAIEMLQLLSGRSHRVLTAVAVSAGQADVRLNSSQVTFRTLSVDECTAYWESGEPADKAGAYAIQGIAAAFIERLEGSYSGVMGLPLYETAALLKQFGVDVIRCA